MNQQKIEPDFKQMASTIDEVVGGVKQDSLAPILKTFMDCLESHGYTDSQILNAIGDYYHSKDSEKYELLIIRLEKTVIEARKINGEKILFD